MILQHNQYLMRNTIDVENLMTSVERIVEYGSLKPEADFHGLNGPVDSLAGSICFKNVWLRYAEDQVYILKDLSFHIQEKEKVCIFINQLPPGIHTIQYFILAEVCNELLGHV